MQRLPRFGSIGGIQQLQQRIFQPKGTGFLLSQIRIYPCRVGQEIGLALGIQLLPFLCCNPRPAQGSQEAIRSNLRLAKHFCQAPGANMPPDIHLPKAFLGVDVPLGHK